MILEIRAATLPSPGSEISTDANRFMTILAWSLCIFMLTTPFYFALTGSSPEMAVVRDLATGRRAEGSALPVYLLRLATLSLAFMLAMGSLGNIKARLGHAVALLSFAGWATLSLLWSDAFTSSLNSLVALLPLVTVAILANGSLSLRETAKVIIFAGLITGVMSVFWALFVPGQGVHQFSDSGQSVHAGNWRGIFIHKNSLGQTFALYFVTALFAGPKVVSRPLKLASMGLFFFLILKSGSASALAICLLGPAIAGYVFYLNTLMRLLVGMIMLLFMSAVIVMLDDILALLGRDITLTGRTQIWSVGLDFIQEKFLIGYGFMTNYGQFANTVSRIVNVFEPHNSYVDTTLGLGIIGLTLFLSCLVSAWRAAVVCRDTGQSADAAVALVGLTCAWAVACAAESAARPAGATAAIGFLACGMVLNTPMIAVRQNRERRQPRAKRRLPA